MMRLLDLFSGAGGAGEGYRRAGFHVVSCDIAQQPHNPHEFYRGDALAVLDTLLAGETWHGYRLHDFAAIHASPPCQEYSALRPLTTRTYAALLPQMRELLQAQPFETFSTAVDQARLADDTYNTPELVARWAKQLEAAKLAVRAILSRDVFGHEEGAMFSASMSGHANHDSADSGSEFANVTITREPPAK